jgi:hypothetical protein
MVFYPQWPPNGLTAGASPGLLSIPRRRIGVPGYTKGVPKCRIGISERRGDGHNPLPGVAFSLGRDAVQEYLSPSIKTGGLIMARMTDEEAVRLDEKWTKNPPNPASTEQAVLHNVKKPLIR